MSSNSRDGFLTGVQPPPLLLFVVSLFTDATRMSAALVDDRRCGAFRNLSTALIPAAIYTERDATATFDVATNQINCD